MCLLRVHSNPCKAKWDRCRAVNVFFNMVLWPLAAFIVGISLMIVGGTTDVDGYWASCGAADDNGEWRWRVEVLRT